MERNAAAGGWLGGNPSYGYTTHPDGGHLAVNPVEAPLIPVIFNLYAREHLGGTAIATQLSAQGHRTRTGAPWSDRSVITVLRNRAYLGEVTFRGVSHPSRHQPLIDPDTFNAAQQVLTLRGEDLSRRASNASDCLLTGLVVCDRCQKRFLGTAAPGKLPLPVLHLLQP
ncbi:MAG TPA: recombinase family protein [Mycobacteriales bacterium]|nr:recombinase family protein [Mycobacteriales bacterium]